MATNYLELQKQYKVFTFCFARKTVCDHRTEYINAEIQYRNLLGISFCCKQLNTLFEGQIFTALI